MGGSHHYFYYIIIIILLIVNLWVDLITVHYAAELS